jgi:hypothetical protein
MTPDKPYKIVLVAIACLQGGYMVVDGIHVLLRHYYISGQAGPWAMIVRKAGLNENDMGPFFIILGSVWLIGGFLNFMGARIGTAALRLAAMISLLYLLFGTLLSLIAIAVLWRQSAVSRSLVGKR